MLVHIGSLIIFSRNYITFPEFEPTSAGVGNMKECFLSLSLRRVAKGEMRVKWLECLPQCKHQITRAWPELIRSETGKTSLFLTVLRECGSLPSILFGRSPLFTRISVVNGTGGIALSRESKQSCLAVLKLLRPCFVSQSSRRYLALLTKGHVSEVCL